METPAFIGSMAIPCFHYRATAAGAEVVTEIKDEDQGGRSFSCLDPEGHRWTVGSYHSWR